MYGKFIENTAGYEINTFDLPVAWEYIYENKDILLKVDQFGPVYAQANPPGDIMIFKREQHQKFLSWFINIITEENERFTNFLKPYNCKIEPKDVKIEYLPECAKYSFTYKGLRISTEIFIPNNGVKIIYKFKIKNTGTETKSIKVRPQLVPYLNDAVIAPWDKYDWYLDTKCEKNEYIIVLDAKFNTQHTSKCILKTENTKFILTTKNTEYIFESIDVVIDWYPKTKKTYGKYGMMREEYLKNHKIGLWNRMILHAELVPHLNEIDRIARERLESILPDLMKSLFWGLGRQHQ